MDGCRKLSESLVFWTMYLIDLRDHGLGGDKVSESGRRLVEMEVREM
jgi:hypothetical protein